MYCYDMMAGAAFDDISVCCRDSNANCLQNSSKGVCDCVIDIVFYVLVSSHTADFVAGALLCEWCFCGDPVVSMCGGVVVFYDGVVVFLFFVVAVMFMFFWRGCVFMVVILFLWLCCGRYVCVVVKKWCKQVL